MRKLTRLRAWLKAPHGIPLLFLWTGTAALIAAAVVLTLLDVPSPWLALVYALYALAAAALGLSVCAAVQFAPRAKHAFFARAEKYPLLFAFFKNYGYRTLALAIFALAVNFAYALLQTALAFLLPSAWYGALAAYYFCLGGLRLFFLIVWHRAKKHAPDHRL